MRRKDREVLDDAAIDAIIQKSKICRLGFYDKGEIYIVPLNFGFGHKDNQRIFYFHSASQGRKIDLMHRCPSVGFELDTGFQLLEAKTACNFSAEYQSVIGTGTVYPVTDAEEKKRGLLALMNTLTNKPDWTLDETMVSSVTVFKLVVQTLSCKQHLV